MKPEEFLAANTLTYRELPSDEYYFHTNYYWIDNFLPFEMRENASKYHLLDDGLYTGYLWHVFSFKILKCLSGEAAREALLEKKPGMCFIYFVHERKTFILDLSESNPLMFDEFTEVYITDIDYRWTYVKTHEDPRNGPYFHEKGMG